MFRAALCVAAAVAVADAAGHDAVVGFEAPVEGLYAANADISPPTTATNASQCAARCLSTPGCISFNLCGTAAPFDCGVSAFNMSYVPGSAAECAWYRRVVERNDTRLGPLAVPWALVPPASGVALTGGPLADAFTNNIVQYLLTRDPADMLHFFALRAGRPLSNSSCYGWGGWIPGSEAGNFLMGGGSALRWLAPGAQPALAAAVAAVVDGIAEYASPNGWAWAFNELQIGDDNLPDYCAAVSVGRGEKKGWGARAVRRPYSPPEPAALVRSGLFADFSTLTLQECPGRSTSRGLRWTSLATTRSCHSLCRPTAARTPSNPFLMASTTSRAGATGRPLAT